MTNEELEKLNQRLDKLEVKLEEVLKQSKPSAISNFFKGFGILLMILPTVIFIHVLIIVGVSAYSLLKGDSSPETVTNPTTPSTTSTPTEPVK